ncbi:protease complex subunit PrcB family protein [uncultured Tenacibaculum sp.]|uniref:protease complex subunit PrcB family protein n=1 Tax=uncultured Tenacibaculum sp. TaxID=174713 RepID=UPI002609C920|nr:protease complex subunit PrcB family protein [uncultured Tenacibaculum sp.]
MKLLSLTISIFFYLSCSPKTTNSMDVQQIMESLYEGTLTGAGEEGFKKESIVIQSVEEWKAFLTKLDSTNKVSEEFDTNIDFSKKSVIVAIDSVRNTTGFTIKINEVSQKGKTLEIVINHKGPKPTDMVGMAITQPIHIVTINKTNKNIVFVEE